MEWTLEPHGGVKEGLLLSGGGENESVCVLREICTGNEMLVAVFVHGGTGVRRLV